MLIHIAEPLAQSVRAGGRLIASGIFNDRERAVVDALEAAGLRVVAQKRETDWVALEAQRTDRTDHHP